MRPWSRYKSLGDMCGGIVASCLMSFWNAVSCVAGHSWP